MKNYIEALHVTDTVQIQVLVCCKWNSQTRGEELYCIWPQALGRTESAWW